MKNINRIISSFAFLILLSIAARGAVLEGTVISSDDRVPVDMAIIKLSSSDWTFTDEHGHFVFDKLKPGRYTYELSYLGYETAKGQVTVSEGKPFRLDITLNPTNLALKEITVTAEESAFGAGSKIGQAAIQHIQAKSVEDMLQLQPGAVTKNPDLSAAGQASIREIDSDGNANNALGTSVLVDGAPVSNDANMQILSTARSGNNSSLQANTLNDQSTAGRGVDLRQISPDNIESIEVVRGIPSAEYGNLTSGAVIIKTKSGQTPWEAIAKVDPNSKLFYIGKGFRWPGKAGSLNFSVDYTKSNSDRRRSYLGYDRITANVAYSNVFMQTSKPLTFNFKASYFGNISDTKSDEEMLKNEYLRNDDQGMRLSLNGTWRLQMPWISNFDYNVSVQYAHQQNIYNKNVGSGAVPFASSYTPGEMEVPFLPTTYLCHYLIDGKPLNVTAQLKANRMFIFGRGSSNFKLGAYYSLSSNKGAGLVFDPSTPPSQGDGQSVRPRSYASVPAMNTLAGFFENQTELNLHPTILTLQAGVRVSRLFVDMKEALRGDIITADPRVNLSWQFLTPENNHLFRRLALTAGYGIASKMPTLASLYPTPAYFDYASYNSYAGVGSDRNLAVMTTVVIPNTANPDLQPARAHKYEVGLNGRAGSVTGSVTFFKEHTTGEFGFVSVPFTLAYNRYYIPSADQSKTTIPSYDDGALRYTMADGTVKNAPYYRQSEVKSYSSPANTTTSDKHGIEYTFNFGRIPGISTDLIVDGAWFWIKRTTTAPSYYSSRVVSGAATGGAVTPFNTYLSVMPEGQGSVRSRFNTDFRFVTHIPAVRLIFSTTVQVVWFETYRNIYEDANGNPLYKRVPGSYGSEVLQVEPVGYYDKEMVYRPWNPAEVERPDELMFRMANTEYFDKQTYPPTCMLNFKLTKEIGRYLNLSFVANNFLKFSKMYYQRQIGGYRQLYTPLYFGAEIKIKI